MKAKIGIIIFAIIFVAGLVVTVNVQIKTIKLKDAKIERLTGNVDELLKENADYVTLNLTQKEANKTLSLHLDSIASLLKIRPKTIEKVVYKEIIQHDTITELIPVVQTTDTTWKFTDEGDCFIYKGVVTLSDDTISVKRKEFSYLNKIIDTFFWKRRFWIFSKKQYFQESRATCGETKTLEINITKRNLQKRN
jgi:hypothetical protein